MNENTQLIPISRETWKRLKDLKGNGITFDRFINDLLDKYSNE